MIGWDPAITTIILARACARIAGGASLALLLAACGASDEGQGVGGVTPSEAQALNEAAAILDARETDAQAALAPDAASDTE